jgi:hypothetical protein
LALSRSTNRNTATGSGGLLGEEGGCFWEDLLLLLEDAGASLEPSELLTLVGAQPLPTALVDLRLGDPVTERLERDPEILRHTAQGGTRLTRQAYGLGPELRRVRTMRCSCQRGLLPGAVAPSLKVSTKAGELQRRAELAA